MPVLDIVKPWAFSLARFKVKKQLDPLRLVTFGLKHYGWC